MREAEEIVRQVLAALEREPRVNLHRHPIAVRYEEGGSLILEGETASLAAKKIALELAASVRGSVGVVDRLRVVPAQKMGDGEIRDHVRDCLLEEPTLARYAIYLRDDGSARLVRESTNARGDYLEAAVEEGVVILNGQVESLSHKRIAGLLAWWVPGTRDVVNGIAVEPPEEDSDDEITDAVRMALEKDRLVSSDSIRVNSAKAIVTLDGVAQNERQAAMAEADAWYIFGVNGVINRLRTLE